MTPTRLAALLRLYRRDTGQSLETVSSAIGISAPTLFWIEQGRPLSLTTYQALWRWLMEPDARAQKDLMTTRRPKGAKAPTRRISDDEMETRMVRNFQAWIDWQVAFYKAHQRMPTDADRQAWMMGPS